MIRPGPTDGHPQRVSFLSRTCITRDEASIHTIEADLIFVRQQAIAPNFAEL
jgi:hypothetical protein